MADPKNTNNNSISQTSGAWIEALLSNGMPTGVLTWDKNINSAKDFAASNYDKNRYRFVGKETQRAYLYGSTSDSSYTVYYGKDGKDDMYHYPNWVQRAKSHLGLTEGNNPIIQAMIDKLNEDFGYADKPKKPISSDKEPWCGVFMYHCLINAGYSVTQKSWQTPALAEFYNKYWKNSKSLKTPAFGAIAYMSWGHVGTVVDYDNKNIWLLGGNQSPTGAAVSDGNGKDEVNIKKYPRSSVVSYALPDSYDKPPLDKFE